MQQTLRHCLRAAGKESLLDGVHFVPANSAKKVPEQAMILKGVSSVPIVALLDGDDEGEEAVARPSGFDWKSQHRILSLRDWKCGCNGKHPSEIEHLLPSAVIDKTVKILGDSAVDGMFKCGAAKRYELSK